MIHDHHINKYQYLKEQIDVSFEACRRFGPRWNPIRTYVTFDPLEFYFLICSDRF